MRTFTSTELSRMQAAQESAMQDVCQILAYSATSDEYGNPDPTYTAGSAIACGFEPVSPREVQGSGEVPVMDARLRLAIDAAVDAEDRIRMTTRYGESLAVSEDYEIEGPVKRGPSGLVVGLRLVDDA